MSEVLLHGLRVASDLALTSGHPDPGLPDVRFLRGPARTIPGDLPPGRLIGTLSSGDGTPFRGISEDDGRWWVRFFHRCDVVVESDLSTVRFWPDPTVDPELLPVFLAGTVIAVVLMLRGHPVLHASAVEVGGRGLAFVGRSGMGKSTLATAFCARGAALITDDVLRIDLDGVPTCRLGATETRLRDGALPVLDGAGGVARMSADGRHLSVPGRLAADGVPLHAIVVPAILRDAGQVAAHRLRAAEALLQLSAFPRVLGWNDERTNREHFEFLGRLLREIPVFAVELPWRSPLPAALAREVASAIELPWPG